MDFSIIHELPHHLIGGCVRILPGRSPGSRIRATVPPFPPALPTWTTDGGYEVVYRLQWRDRPGFTPGSLFSLSGTWNIYNSPFQFPSYPYFPVLSNILRSRHHWSKHYPQPFVIRDDEPTLKPLSRLFSRWITKLKFSRELTFIEMIICPFPPK